MKQLAVKMGRRLLALVDWFDQRPDRPLSKRHILGRAGLVALFLLVLAAVLTIIVSRSQAPAILSPAGQVASQERSLIYTSTLLMLLIVVPVIVMTLAIGYRYRASRQARYTPDWDHNLTAETVWWTVPLLLIIMLSGLAWQSSHTLDPFRPIASTKTALDVQVVALDWKWLFIYPKQGIASLNQLHLPVGTPVNFQITADAPMNSFWIPQLGGQVYAMPGMSTQLHLVADKAGSYRGRSANLSGSGFASMQFQAVAEDQAAFDSWVRQARRQAKSLGLAEYQELAQPGTADQPVTYGSAASGLYDKVLMKYMAPDAMEMGN